MSKINATTLHSKGWIGTPFANFGQFLLLIQLDQIKIAVFFWYLVKSDLSSVYPYIRQVTFYQKHTAMFNWSPCITWQNENQTKGIYCIKFLILIPSRLHVVPLEKKYFTKRKAGTECILALAIKLNSINSNFVNYTSAVQCMQCTVHCTAIEALVI